MLPVHGVVMPPQPKEVLPELGADGIVHHGEDPSVRPLTGGSTQGPDLLAALSKGPDPVAQEPIEAGEVALDEAGKDDLRHPKTAVEMRQDQHESTEVAIA